MFATYLSGETTLIGYVIATSNNQDIVLTRKRILFIDKKYQVDDSETDYSMVDYLAGFVPVDYTEIFMEFSNWLAELKYSISKKMYTHMAHELTREHIKHLGNKFIFENS